MSRKRREQKVATLQPLPQRLAKARREGRTQQALELARQHHKQEPGERSLELLRQVTMERGLQLQGQGYLRDAGTVFTNALELGGGPEFRAHVAQHLATCGAIAPALRAMEELGDPGLRQQVLNHIADAAVAQGPAGKTALPPDLRAGFDLILQAFTHYEASHDEEARAALQGIGLQSPFLEWKVFLRGLLAYHAKDDGRARENWQRLDQARLPARLSATMRATIDSSFLQAQPADVQQTLQTKMLQQQGVNIAPILLELREMLHDDNLAPAFRKAENLLPILRRDHAELAPRLAQCFRWALINQGQPEDLERYMRVFGPTADDPDLHCLTARALETRGMWAEAHSAWQDYIKDIAKEPQRYWPGETAAHVQALIWARMAENAGVRRTRRTRSGNPFFDLFADNPAPLKPGAEKCYESAIKLAPDRLESYLALFELYRREDKVAKAKKLGQQLLKRFPDHADTLAALGDLWAETGDHKKAIDHYQKAIAANPLDQTLRAKLVRAKLNHALALTLAGNHDLARAQYEQASELCDRSKASLLCQWAVAEMKALQLPRAEELIAQALAEPDHRLACRFALVGASVRAKLSAQEKKQFAQDLKTALAETPTPAEVLVVLEGAARDRLTHDEAFHGQKTQERTILKFLDGIQFTAFDEAQLRRLCLGLTTLNARKPWLKCLDAARRRFLKNPFFRLSYVNYYLLENTKYPRTDLARQHLDQARRLVEELPRGEQQQQYLEQIKTMEEVIAEMNARRPPMMGMFDQMFGGGSGPDFDENDDDFDDGW